MESFKTIISEFFKGAISGAVASMLAFYSSGSIKEWSEFSGWIGALAFAGTIGAIGGGLLALYQFFKLPQTKEAIGKVFGRK